MLTKSNDRKKVLQNWTSYALAILVPVWLLFAHLDQGADGIATSAIFSLGLAISFAVLIVSSGLSNVTTSMVLIAAIFIAWYAAGLFGPWPIAKHEVQALAAAGAIAGIGYTIAKQQKIFRLAWISLNWSLLLFSLLAIFAFLSDGGGVVSNDQGRFDGRLSGSFGSPNTAATLLGLAVLLAASHILLRLSDSKFARLSRTDRIYYFAQSEYASFGLLIIAGMSLLLTMSRAGIFVSLACLAALAVLELLRVSRNGSFNFVRRKRFQIPIGVALTVALGLAFTGEINPYNSEPLLQNSSSRMVMYETYLTIWLEQPWFGHGVGSFHALNDSHTNLDNAAHLVTIGAAHNVALQWLIQQGIIGLTIMTLILGLILYPIVNALRRTASVPRHFLRMSLAATVLVFAHGMVDYALEIPSVMWTYAYIIGLASGFATSAMATKQKSDE